MPSCAVLGYLFSAGSGLFTLEVPSCLLSLTGSIFLQPGHNPSSWLSKMPEHKMNSNGVMSAEGCTS